MWLRSNLRLVVVIGLLGRSSMVEPRILNPVVVGSSPTVPIERMVDEEEVLGHPPRMDKKLQLHVIHLVGIIFGSVVGGMLLLSIIQQLGG